MHPANASLNGTLIERLRQHLPKHFVGEVLTKRWSDSITPFLISVLVVASIGLQIDGYFRAENLNSIARLFSEVGIVSLGMGLVVIVGGIDLSVGSIFALANFAALYLIVALEWPLWAAVPTILLLGGLLGAINGALCGLLRIKAFLITLVTMVIYRSISDLLVLNYSNQLAMAYNETPGWLFLGEGDFLGLPSNMIALAVVAILGHIVLTRTRIGAHIFAIGGNRLAAHHSGIATGWTIFWVYVASGVLSAFGGIFYAARLNSASALTGYHLEITALTAVVLGGVSLGGGRGSAIRVIMGTIITLVLVNGMLRLGMHGSVTDLALGLVLLLAVAFDVKWVKHRLGLLDKVYISSFFWNPPRAATISEAEKSVFAPNDRLHDVELIGLGQIEGPEDVILDRNGNLYTGVRQGWIVRFMAPDFNRSEIFARIGGRPLGMAFDEADNLITCVAGMGLYGVRPDGTIYKLTDRNRRTWWSLRDDSRITMADDLDIAPDGRIFFSEATIRYSLNDWILDSFEGVGNGKISCFNPKTGTTSTVLRNLRFSNGICTSHDGQSILFNETWSGSVSRYWISGPKTGTTETIIGDLPGFPDNINRASDGNYWVAMAGIRSPIWDLVMRRPSFRTRMIKRLPRDEWLFPNVNAGFIAKITEAGDVLDVLWDLRGVNHPAVTSMREHKGMLYIGGLTNNRIGRIAIDGAIPDWVGPESYWGKR